MIIEEIEGRLESLLAKGSSDWLSIAELIQKVEREELWRDAEARSFTAWVKGLSRKVGLCQASVWRIYSALETIKRVDLELNPGDENEIREVLRKHPWITVSGLVAISKVENMKLDEKYVQHVKKEYVEGTLCASEINEIAAEVERCKKANIKNVKPLLAVRKASILEIIGRKTDKFKLVTDTQKSQGMDAIAVLKSHDDIELVGVFIDRFEQVDLLDAFDYVIVFRTINSSIIETSEGLVDLDLITGETHVILQPKKRATTDQVKDKMCRRIFASFL
jgi:hypothetical protein